MKKLISMRSLVIQAYVWLAFPVLIFMFGWIRLLIALPVVLLICAVLFRIFRSGKDSRYFRSEGFAGGVPRDRTFYMIMASLFLLCVIMGLGALFYQIEYDMGFRNAVEFDLIRRPWPVTYPNPDGSESLLCYYFAFWLPSAIVGKLAGGMIIPADLFTLFYAFWGIALVLCFILSFTGNRRRWLVFLIFIFFCEWNSECLYVRSFEVRNAFTEFTYATLRLTNDYYSTANVCYLLGLIYNQGVPTLLCCMLMWYQRNNYGILLFTYSLLCLFAPFPVVGLFPCMLVYALRHIKPCFTWENITGIIIAAVSGLFLASNNNASSPTPLVGEGVVAHWLLASLVCFLLSTGVYLPFVWGRLKKNMFFYGMWFTVLCLGLFRSGSANDLSWRAGIPLYFMLCVAVIKTAVEAGSWRKPKRICFAIVLAMGAVGPVRTIVCQFSNELECIAGGTPVKSIYYMGKLHSKEYNPCYDNFNGDSGIFYTKYLKPERRNRCVIGKEAE